MAAAAAAEQGLTDEAKEELECLASIYGDDFRYEDGIVELAIPTRDAEPRIVARAALPRGYPSASGAPPIAEIDVPTPPLPAALAAEAAARLEQDFAAAAGDGGGEPVLFAWFEWLREQCEEPLAAAAAAAAADAEEEEAAAESELARLRLGDDGHGEAAPAQQRHHQTGGSRSSPSGEDELVAAVAARIVSGEPLTVQKSTFQAHVAPVTSRAEAAAVVAALLRNPKVAGATHPAIMAYRVAVDGPPAAGPSGNNSSSSGANSSSGATAAPHPKRIDEDYDDCGEAAAGGRLLRLLQLSGAEGVCAVVTRWFGGTLMGPSRFGVITGAARDLLVACGYIAGAGGGGAGDEGQQQQQRQGGGKRKGPKR